jgi:uncharacterized protein (TIGR03437 family)
MRFAGTLWLVVFMLSGALFAQPPKVTAVLNSVTGQPKLAPALLARVLYTPLNVSDTRHVAPIHETVFVSVSGRKALVTGIEADSNGGGAATIVIPDGLPLGVTTLLLTNAAGASSSFSISLGTYSPGLIQISTHCDGGAQVAQYNAIGLGPSVPLPPGPPNGQNPATAVIPAVTVGGRPAAVIDSYAVPNYGIYSGSFKVPADVPEGFQPVVLTIGGDSSNAINMLVGTQNYAGLPLSPGSPQVAPSSIASSSNCSMPLAKGQFSGDPLSPPQTLGGTTVTIKDSQGIARAASLLFASPTALSYIIPGDSASGSGTVVIAVDDHVVSSSAIDIQPIAPLVFFRNVYLVRVRNGAASLEQPGFTLFGKVLIDLGPETDQVYVIIPATGLRNRSSLGSVKLRLDVNGPIELPALYAGPQGAYQGVDQVNVLLPRFPPGVLGFDDGAPAPLIVDGKVANQLYVVLSQTDSAAGVAGIAEGASHRGRRPR